MYGPDERYYILTKVGELVDAQTIDDFGVVVSSVYRYDGKYHFIKRHWPTDYWFDIEDKEELKTIKEYHRRRIRRKLEYGAPPSSEVSSLSKLMWRLYAVLDRRAFCRVKDEIEHETDIYEHLTDRETVGKQAIAQRLRDRSLRSESGFEVHSIEFDVLHEALELYLEEGESN